MSVHRPVVLSPTRCKLLIVGRTTRVCFTHARDGFPTSINAWNKFVPCVDFFLAFGLESTSLKRTENFVLIRLIGHKIGRVEVVNDYDRHPAQS